MRLRTPGTVLCVFLSLCGTTGAAETSDRGMRLKIGYQYLAAGQNITKLGVPSRMLLHAGTISLEPFWWLNAGFVAGGQSFSVEPFTSKSDNRRHDFSSDYAFGAGWRFAVRSPGFFAPSLRAVGRFCSYQFSSTAQGFAYTGSLRRFNGGIAVSPIPLLSVESGIASHLLKGKMGPKKEPAQGFANTTRARPYLSIDVLSRDRRFFAGMYLDLSSEVEGPVRFFLNEATVQMEAGYLFPSFGARSRRLAQRTVALEKPGATVRGNTQLAGRGS